jgi:hypothetical protein
LLLVVLFVVALAMTFWPKRSVALPTIPAAPASPPAGPAPSATDDRARTKTGPAVGVERVVPIAALEESVQRLEERVAELERSVRDEAPARSAAPFEEESLPGM